MSEPVLGGRTAVEWADEADEAIRAIAHVTTITGVVPAPQAYQLFGTLKLLGWRLADALRYTATGLQRSLQHFDVYEDDGTDPARSISVAQAYLRVAAAQASELGHSIEAAQSAIAGQGYR